MIAPRWLHVLGRDMSLGRAGQRLAVRQRGGLVQQVPLVLLSKVVLHGDVAVSAGALRLLLERDVPLVLLSRSGRALGRLEPPGNAHVWVRQRQLSVSSSASLWLDLARRVVAGKLHNQRVLVARQLREHPAVLADARLATGQLEGLDP